jgi:hypothetical protein
MSTNSSARPRANALELVIISAVALYIELLAIRWISADIRAFSIFKTFPLIACFVGLGVGLATKNRKLFHLTCWALVQFVVTMRLAAFTHGAGFPTQSILLFDDRVMSPLSMALLLILILAGPFSAMVCIGSRLGELFNKMEPLPGYACNLFGSLIGSVIFTAVSYSGISPWNLLVPVAILITYYLRDDKKTLIASALATILIPIVYIAMPENDNVSISTYWSPYQRLDLTRYRMPGDPTKLFGLHLAVNHGFYMYFFRPDVDRSLLPKETGQLVEDRNVEYFMPFQMVPNAKDVLVVGAGAGQNVTAALRSAAAKVDAVEIDPTILKIGKESNPDYSSDRVNLINDDARHYFRHADRKYDLILFGLLDSQAAAGQGASLRLDNYVYTKQSFEECLNLLRPQGLMVVTFGAAAPWVGPRLYATLEQACGYKPLCLRKQWSPLWGGKDLSFVAGKPVQENKVAVPVTMEVVPFGDNLDGRALTDDWPYLYVKSNMVDYSYLMVMGEIILLTLYVGRRVLSTKEESTRWQMFFLGAAFLLLELHAISFLALIYGSTWMTSALVINGILIMIFLANLIVMRFKTQLNTHQPTLYLILVATILLSYLTPGSKLLASDPSGLMVVTITIVTLAPMCVAGVVFATAFSRAQIPATALAFNMLGAVVGGLLEYVSNYFGIKSLELLAVGLYLSSLLCFLQQVRPLQSLKSEG